MVSGNASLDAEKIKSELFPQSEILCWFLFSVFLATLRLEGRDLGGGVIPLTMDLPDCVAFVATGWLTATCQISIIHKV